MDFLETDFHKKKAPKRSISYTNSQWYLVWVSLAKYEKITDSIRKTINEWFDKDSQIKVKKWTYTTTVPKNFLDVIKLNVNKFSEDIITEIVEQVSKETGSELSVKRFVRFETGEGLEKKNEDFAAEVAAQL